MQITDEEKQEMLDKMVAGKLEVSSLDKDHFQALLDALKRMFSARIFNCVDATGKWDAEWRVLSNVFERVLLEWSPKL